MLLRSNQDLFDTIKALAGVNDFTSNEEANLVSLTNRRLTTAYNTSPSWDRYIVVGEKRRLSKFKVGDGVNSTAYNDVHYYKLGTDSANENDLYVPINQVNSTDTSTHFVKNSSDKWVWGAASYTFNLSTEVVTLSGGITFATQQDTENRASPADVLDWGDVSNLGGTLRTSAAQVVLYDETHDYTSSGDTRQSKQKINDFMRIHKDRSFLNRSATEYDFYVDSNGANVLNAENLDEVYVTYKKPIVDQTTGVVISSLTSGSQIPSEFFNYTAHSVYADFLRMDGQLDKADMEEQKADLFLASELERIDIINNNNSLNRKISTHINRTLR